VLIVKGIKCRAMHHPRMTTRRWMIAVAILSIALGASVWASRLKLTRDEFSTRATWHAAQETYYRRLVADSAKVPVSRRIPAPPQEPPPQTITAPVRTIERWFGLPESHSTPAEGDDRFKAAQARSGELSARGEMLWAKYVQRQAEYNQRKLEYHTALRRKYIAAAGRPWLTIDPDPPKPK
jgi:hypothetical protein